MHPSGLRETLVTGIASTFALFVAAMTPAFGDDADVCIRGQGQESVDACTRALNTAPPHVVADLFLGRGAAHYSLGQYDKAVLDFTSAIGLRPRFRDAYLDRGAAYHHLGQYERAIEDDTKAMMIEPGFAGACYNRALSYFRLGRFADALKDFDRAAKLDPKDAKAVYGRGLSRAHLGENAEADFAAARAIDPDIAAKFAREGLTP